MGIVNNSSGSGVKVNIVKGVSSGALTDALIIINEQEKNIINMEAQTKVYRDESLSFRNNTEIQSINASASATNALNSEISALSYKNQAEISAAIATANANETYSRSQLDAGQLNTLYYTKTNLDGGQLDNRYYTETELNSGALDIRYYTEAEIDAKLAAQNDASEITVVPTGNLASNNVQAALVELQGDIDNIYTKSETTTLLAGKVDRTTYTGSNLDRADKILANQNIANMLYDNKGNLVKIRYKTDTDTDYEVLSYTNNSLTSIEHYVSSVLKGTTTLSYTSGNLVSAIFVGV